MWNAASGSETFDAIVGSCPTPFRTFPCAILRCLGLVEDCGPCRPIVQSEVGIFPLLLTVINIGGTKILIQDC